MSILSAKILAINQIFQPLSGSSFAWLIMDKSTKMSLNTWWSTACRFKISRVFAHSHCWGNCLAGTSPLRYKTYSKGARGSLLSTTRYATSLIVETNPIRTKHQIKRNHTSSSQIHQTAASTDTNFTLNLLCTPNLVSSSSNSCLSTTYKSPSSTLPRAPPSSTYLSRPTSTPLSNITYICKTLKSNLKTTSNRE